MRGDTVGVAPRSWPIYFGEHMADSWVAAITIALNDLARMSVYVYRHLILNTSKNIRIWYVYDNPCNWLMA
jgi:hypothetical protein